MVNRNRLPPGQYYAEKDLESLKRFIRSLPYNQAVRRGFNEFLRQYYRRRRKYAGGLLRGGMTREEAAKLLGVPIGAPERVVKKAYRKLARTYHPDRNRMNVDAATRKMKAVNEAYTVLTQSSEEIGDAASGSCSMYPRHRDMNCHMNAQTPWFKFGNDKLLFVFEKEDQSLSTKMPELCNTTSLTFKMLKKQRKCFAGI